jgi:UDP-glucose 4-epimerase
LYRLFRNTGKIQNVVSIRIFDVFGEEQSFRNAGVITKFAERLSARLPLMIYGNGDQTRDFIFVDDLVSAIVLSASVADKMQAFIIILSFFLCAHFKRGNWKSPEDKRSGSNDDQNFDLDLEPVFAESRIGDIVNSLADISRLKIVLDLGPPSDRALFETDV